MTKAILTQEYLKECLHYDPETGVFTWLDRPVDHFRRPGYHKAWRRKIGKECGHIECEDNYRVIVINDVAYGAHRLAVLWMTGEMPEFVDHENHIRYDNRWSNLKTATPLSNQRNKSKGRNNTSGVTGVSWEASRKKWGARIMVNRKSITIGRFDTIEDAALARKLASQKYGFHENHGQCRS